MKKLINLIALVMLVSTNVLTPFSYAQEETPEVIPENEVGNVEGIGETPEKDNEITGEIPNSLGEVEGERSLPLVREVVNESEPEGLKEEVEDSLDVVKTPAPDEDKKEDTEKVEIDEVVSPVEENTEDEKQEENLEDNNEVTEQENVEIESQGLQKIQEISTMDTATNSKNIVLQATATEAGQTLKINKYFKNAYTVSRCDGCETLTLSSDTGHTYEEPGTYTITLSLTGSATRWTFQNVSKPLVPTNGTTVTDVKIVSMPSLADGFGNSETNPGNDFFYYFNKNGKLTSLPEGSFDTSKITTVGYYFFGSFNYNGQLTSLPEGSFRLSTGLTTVGYGFFYSFNNNGQLTSLPEGSFRLSTGLTTVGDSFFYYFNANGQLTSLPSGSFDISNITTVGNYFFYYFNYNGQLTSLPSGSFDTSKITTVGDSFFSNFNYNGQLTSLPSGSFDISNITTVGNYFFNYFNSNGKLTSLPEGSFRLSTGLTTAGNSFFYGFNGGGQLTSLPEGSFDTSNITKVGSNFFRYFNGGGQLTSLPEGSFDTSNITTTEEYFFSYFNEAGKLTSLPEGSFDTSNITKVGNYFFSNFNSNGKLTSLPEGSFDTSNITTVGNYFFNYFNYNGQLTSLPESFKLSSAAYNEYYYAFNSPSYTLNRNVSDLVEGITPPSSKQYTFSDNQPGRCGVHPNWLETTADACSISYDDGLGGTGEFKYTADTTGVEVGSGMIEPIREGYSFSGWIDASGNNVDEIVFPEMDGQTLYANWTPNEYTITFEDSSEENEKIVISGLYLSDTSSIKYPKWTKEGYKIVWDKEIPATMPAENMIIKAIWERNGSSGGGGGGGSSKDTDKDTHGSAEDSQKNSEENAGKEIPPVSPLTEGGLEQPEGQNDSSLIKGGAESEVTNGKVEIFTPEFQQAYKFAHENGITTKDTIQSAQMNGKLTRIAMAKMLSQYAINVLGQIPDTSKTVKFKDVSNKKDADYDNGVTLAYQLGIMGQNMPNNRFRPNDEVSRAEFATALSRLLYQTTDGKYKSTKEYYIPHMAKLYNEGIISNTDPSMAERRGYVMIMLMRSAK